MKLYKDIERAFDCFPAEPYVEISQGRITERTARVLPAEKLTIDTTMWQGLKSIVMIERTSKKNTEASFYISSVDATPQQAAHIVRSHWGIENNLHWQLDVTFREDLGRDRNHNAAQNHSLLRKIALTVLSYYKPEISNPRKRKMMSMNPSMISDAIGREGFWGKFMPVLDAIRDYRPPASSKPPKEPFALCGHPIGLDKS